MNPDNSNITAQSQCTIQVGQKKDTIDQVRASWLAGLEALVLKIGGRFAHYFASMGFAGDVALSRGQHQNDFANYGIDILVKYRDDEQCA